MNKGSKKRSRVSYEQREKMFEFMVAHPDFARNRVAGAEVLKLKLPKSTVLSSRLVEGLDLHPYLPWRNL
ncbi:unnamed protein product [Parnassius apollo]|uniref:(apollo) hypothetical protein n=1 Tax=Parnassius apollo TaxID=110799 RepID=A0A8S3WK85_PARAO|nr:unnamed protein product [Parnassius apollo]